MPVGSIISFGGTIAPTGWLLCDGAAVSRTTYSDLFAVIGTNFGYGDNSTTFNIPDLRGRFLRGQDGNIGRDPDRASRTAMNTGGNTGDAVGSIQADAMQGHRHYANGSNDVSGGSSPSRLFSIDSYPSPIDTKAVGSPTTDNVNGTPRTSSETRSINANVNYIIKY